MSFSVFGLGIIFGVGGLITILSFTLEPIMYHFSSATTFLRRNPRAPKPKPHSLLEWRTNEILQLQRLAHEAVGFGTWSKTTSAIPVTDKGELLARLDVNPQGHPRLVRALPLSHFDSVGKEDPVTTRERRTGSPGVTE